MTERAGVQQMIQILNWAAQKKHARQGNYWAAQVEVQTTPIPIQAAEKQGFPVQFSEQMTLVPNQAAEETCALEQFLLSQLLALEYQGAHQGFLPL